MKAVVRAMLGVCLALAADEARGFGKNKVIQKTLDWRVHRTEHIEVYYYPEASARVAWVAAFAEAAYRRIAEDLGLREESASRRSKLLPIVLFLNRRDLDQTPIFRGFLTEGIRGFSEPLRGRMVVPLDGPKSELEQLIVHEMTHLLTYRAVGASALQQWSTALPLWFSEGLAEHQTGVWAAWDEGILRDAVLRGGLVPLARLTTFDGLPQPFLGYAIGHAAVDFLETRHGPGAVARVLRELRRQRVKRLDRAIYLALGLRPDQIDQELHHALVRRYSAGPPTVSDASRPWPDASSRWSDVGASLSPAGELLAHVTNRGGPLQIAISRIRDGGLFASVQRTDGNEEGFLTEGRPLSWSPDGNILAFTAARNARDLLVLWDLSSRRVSERIDLGLERTSCPSFHPDGDRIAVAGEFGGRSDLFVFDRQSGETIPLTQDEYFDTEPVWSSDGRRLLYSSERGGRFSLVERDTQNSTERVLLGGNGVPFGAMWSRDGLNILCVLDRGGTENVYELDGSSGALRRMTSALGRANAPCALPGGGILYVDYSNGRYALRSLPAGASPLEVIRPSPPPLQGFAPDDPESRPSARLEAISAPARIGLKDFAWTLGWAEDSRLQLGAGVVVSDLLAERQLSVRVGSDGPLEDLAAGLSSIRRRLEMSLSLGHRREHVFFRGERLRQSEQWARLGAVYALDREHRVEVNLGLSRRRNSMPYGVYDTEPRAALALGAELVGDRVVYSSFGPLAGTRFRASGAISIPVGRLLSQRTLAFDLRHYRKLMRRWVLASRVLAATSMGEDPVYFSLGGAETLRGMELGALTGEKVMLGNLELRFPLIDGIRLASGWGLRNLRGAVFVDLGSAFDRWESLDLWQSDPKVRLQDLKAAFGIRASVRLSRLDLRLDAGWSTDLQTVARRPEVSFTIGSGSLF